MAVWPQQYGELYRYARVVPDRGISAIFTVDWERTYTPDMKGEAAHTAIDPWEAFQATEIRVGTIIETSPFPEARIPAIKIRIDFGSYGSRWSSAQITDRYQPGRLVGRQVVAVVNLPPKRIAGFKSECLVLGLPDAEDAVVLVVPDGKVPDGGRLY